MMKLKSTRTELSWMTRWLPPILAGSAAGLLIVLVVFLQVPAADPLEVDDTPPEMVLIPGGTFVMGSDTSDTADEKPAHEVTLKSFRMCKTELTNGQFAAFVKATRYKTVAEQKPDPSRYPDADLANLVPGSAVFVPVDARVWEQGQLPVWWKYQPGADWRHPEGPKSSIKGRKNYPVVHIAWTDAVAYCEWAKVRLPTEAEWEYAARGGLKQKPYVWGSDPQGTNGKWFANTFQGTFPKTDTGEDGYVGIAPVAKYPANGFGLYDMSGNVWEWCSDIYNSEYYAKSPKENPPGPKTGEKEDGELQRVRRGGSFLCADSYCKRYVPNARDKNPTDSGAIHTGFRFVRDE